MGLTVTEFPDGRLEWSGTLEELERHFGRKRQAAAPPQSEAAPASRAAAVPNPKSGTAAPSLPQRIEELLCAQPGRVFGVKDIAKELGAENLRPGRLAAEVNRTARKKTARIEAVPGKRNAYRARRGTATLPLQEKKEG